MNVGKGDSWKPTPEMLSAYLDGEFDDAASAETRAAVEAWLDSHPDLRACLVDWRSLQHAWRQTSPPEPDEESWAQLLASIHERLDREVSAPTRRRRFVQLGVVGTAAAAVLLAALIARGLLVTPGGPAGGQGNVVAPLVDPLPVATADEVEILRVGGDDTRVVVVGTMPVEGLLVVAQKGDVELTEVVPSDDNSVSEMGPGDSGLLVWPRPSQDDPVP